LKAALATANDENNGESTPHAIDKKVVQVDVIETTTTTVESPATVTTEEELEGYVTVRLLLRDAIEKERIYYRDNLSYFNILVDNSIRKWVCRLGFNTSNKYIKFNDDEKTTVYIEHISDMDQYKDKLVEIAKKFA
jgi:predicted type IV restriction endonuclease